MRRRYRNPGDVAQAGVLIPVRDLVLILVLLLLLWVGAGRLGGFAVQAADRGEPFTWSRRRVATFAREVAARSMMRVTDLVGWVEPRMPSSVGDDRPILLVAEPGTSRWSMAWLALFLRRHGHRRVMTVDCGPVAVDLAERGNMVDARIAALVRATGGAPIDVVAFAVGGLAVAWSLRHLAGAGHVRRFVTIGTPWQGTKLSVFGGPRTPWEIPPWVAGSGGAGSAPGADGRHLG